MVTIAIGEEKVRAFVILCDSLFLKDQFIGGKYCGQMVFKRFAGS